MVEELDGNGGMVKAVMIKIVIVVCGKDISDVNSDDGKDINDIVETKIMMEMVL